MPKVILDPDGQPIPDKPALLWAVVSALAKRASTSNCGRVFRYAQRMFEAGHGEFAVLMVKDIIRLHPDVQNTPEWAVLCVSDLGKAFLG